MQHSSCHFALFLLTCCAHAVQSFPFTHFRCTTRRTSSLQTAVTRANGFRRTDSNRLGCRRGSNEGGGPPSNHRRMQSQSSGDDHSSPCLISTISYHHNGTVGDFFVKPRGGGHINRQDVKSKSIAKRTSSTLAATASFWGDSLHSLAVAVGKPFKGLQLRVSTLFQNQQQRDEDLLMEQLKTMPIRHVTVPNSTVLPLDVIHIAARRSGMVGNPLRMDRVQDFAQAVKRWYTRKGYVLHSVTGATLRPETATAEITVQEPLISSKPVDIVFCKEMVIDNVTGELMSFRQYKDKQATRRTIGFDRIDKSNLNTTYVITSGKTKPNKIASALGLTPGMPFQWDGDRWQKVVNSGIFGRVLQATPQPMNDGSVQFQIMVAEAPPRHLEYGLGKSLYTGSWEGELDFEHGNLLGGGEVLGLSIRREGTKSAQPSVRVSFGDDRFGMEGGYDVEIFSDYLVDDSEGKTDSPDAEQNVHGRIGRRGVTFRLRNPIDTKVIRNTVASASLERTTADLRKHEVIGSCSLGVGPFLRELPMGARSNLDARFMVGTRVVHSRVDEEVPRHRFLPYSSVTSVTRQTFPLLQSSRPARPLILAFRHSITSATSHLPTHEAKVQGTTLDIRGSNAREGISTALAGTTELRIPILLPIVKTRQDATVVVFGDWILAKKDSASPFMRRSCIGLGFRKSLQGIPLKYDVSYSSDRRIKASFGLGRDFEV